MTGTDVFLAAPHFVLGEFAADHTAIPGLPARAREFRMAPDAGTWGWGMIRRTGRSLEALAVASGSATLRAAAADPSSVDLLVLCSTRFPHGAVPQGRFMQAVLTGLGLGNAAFAGVTMNRCANLVAALDLACSLVSSHRYRRILVVTTDRAEDEASRMESFALFSDGAASCLVVGDLGGQPGYQFVSSAVAQEPGSLGSTNEISSDLGRQVNDRLLTPLDMKAGDVAGLMHANIFKPILVMKELQAGFAPQQLWTRNISRIGHCFAADPLINLVDQDREGLLRDGCYYLLASSVPGTRIGVLLRRVAGAPARAAANPARRA